MKIIKTNPNNQNHIDNDNETKCEKTIAMNIIKNTNNNKNKNDNDTQNNNKNHNNTKNTITIIIRKLFPLIFSGN